MTQEEKQLLLKDLCSRLLYNVKVAIDFKSYLELLPDDDDDSEYPYKKNLNTILRCSNKSIDDISQKPHIVHSYMGSERFSMLWGYENREYGVPVELIKPYLRPMSSMTDTEKKELENICTMYNGDPNSSYEYFGVEILNISRYGTNFESDYTAIDWLNAHHFDYRGLIEKGLALEAPKDLYK